MTITESMPEFSLKGTDSLMHSSMDFNSSKILVIIFTCNHCPYARAYIRRIADFVQNFRSQGVTFIAINPNDAKKYPQDSFEHMIPMAKELGLDGLYLRDESQDVAKSFAAQRTPEVFVFDVTRSLVYKGAIDDNYESEQAVNQFYLRDVINALLSGSEIERKETNAIGCSIKWK